MSRPFATFRALQRSFPRSAAAWSGEADANLRLAYQLPADQPFRARRLYTDALALYRRAARLAPGPESDAGLARALAGLGRPAEAVAAQRRAIAAGPRTAALVAPLVEYLESAHRFDEAARTAEQLPGLPLEPAAPAPLYPFIRPKTYDHPLNERDAAGPLSFGVGRMAPLNVDLQPSPLPVVESKAPSVHWAGPVALGALGLALTARTVWLDVPLTRAAAIAAMVMAASLLTPIKPLDGAAVSAAGQGGTAVAGLGLALLLLLGLL